MLILKRCGVFSSSQSKPIVKDFWGEGRSWRTVWGLIKRITFPNEDPGGWLLPEAMQQASNPIKTRPNWPVQAIEYFLPNTPAPLLQRLTSFCQGCFLWFYFFILAHVCVLFPSVIFRITHLHPACPVSHVASSSALFIFKAHTSFPLSRLQVHLVRPPVFLLLRYRIPSQLWQDVALHLLALRDETVVGQRCQISDYEHLEDVNVINANQIPLTAIGRSSGLGGRGRLGRNRAKRRRGSATEAMKGGRGCCFLS